MDIIGNLLVSTPSGLWFTIFDAFESFVLNYAWAIILITVCIKLILSPLDLMNKKVSRDNARMQAVIGPQMEQLKQKYGHDRNLLNQKTAELYKKNGFSMGGSCVVMLVYLVITMVVFFTLFSSLNTNSRFKSEEQYLELNSVYFQTYKETAGDEAEKTQAAQQKVLQVYDERNNKFFWVQNVYLADNPWTQSVLSFENYLNLIGDSVKTNIDDENSVSYKEMSDEDKANFKRDYNKVMLVLQEQRNGPNGYLLTCLIAVLTAFFSQYFIQRQTQAKANKGLKNQAGTQKTNKILLIILPVVMGLFTLFYNALFGLYIIANQLMTILLFPIIDLILDKIYKNKDLKEKKQNTVDYSRR